MVAYHESGHVLAAMRWLGHTARAVSIDASVGGKLGHAEIPLTARPRAAHTDTEWRRIRVPEAVMFVAGLAAEEVAGYGRSTGIRELERIAHVQNRGVVSSALERGLRQRPVARATDDLEGALSALVDAFPTRRDPLRRFLRVYSFAVHFLARSRPTLDRLATELEMRRALTAAEIEVVVGTDLPARPGSLRARRG